ncbi:alpha/beta hydrolase fold domain-containing protein [Verrucomicrobia bacterium]|nr:alpha/beta hydrolase fold domain-containing protein [Verrucomicrobiota bacterium]
MKLFSSSLLVLFILTVSGFSQTSFGPERQAKVFFEKNDKNRDGRVGATEFPYHVKGLFKIIDKNKDGAITLAEDVAYRKSRLKRGGRSGDGVAAGGTRVLRDLVYARVGERNLPLDLYLPAKSSKPLPVLMWIHGGGWRSGKKGNAGPAKPLVERGFAVVDVEYRLSGEAIFPAQVQDCKAAVRWVRANAKKYDLDPDRIAVWGSSAGGHLVAFLGTSGGVKEFETDANEGFSSRVNLVVDWFGPTDLLQMNDQAVKGARMDHNAPDSPESLLVGGPLQKEPFRSVAVKANPITYVSSDDPEFLIVHGDNDLLVSHKQSLMLNEALKKAGVKTTLQIVKNGGHGFKKGVKNSKELAEEAFDFLVQRFKKK